MNKRTVKLYARRATLIIGFVIIIVAIGFLAHKLTSPKPHEKVAEVNSVESNEVKVVEAEKLPPRTFTLTGLGDVMCHNTQYKDAYVSANGTYDFNYVFENVTADTIVAGTTENGKIIVSGVNPTRIVTGSNVTVK